MTTGTKAILLAKSHELSDPGRPGDGARSAREGMGETFSELQFWLIFRDLSPEFKQVHRFCALAERPHHPVRGTISYRLVHVLEIELTDMTDLPVAGAQFCNRLTHWLIVTFDAFLLDCENPWKPTLA
jgi:hypothetical protein